MSRRRYRRLPRVDIPGATYFITCCIDRQRPLLKREELAALIIQLYAEARDAARIALHAYVVMPDHYHIVLTLREERSVSALVRRVHSLFWRRAVQSLPQEVGRVWQRRFYDHVVRDEKDWQERVAYVHANPVIGGLVSDPVEYRWSSCRYWETGEGAVRCEPPWDG
jgi:putative transposase